MTNVLRWDQGRSVIDDLLGKRHLEQVSANIEHAEKLLEHAHRHVASAESLRDTDLELAFSAAYDAARKALTAVLAVQGLRPTSAGGHLAVYYASLAQFEPPMGTKIKRFDWMRRVRNDTEYPQLDSIDLDVDDVNEATAAAHEVIKMAGTLIALLPPYGK